eukprot:362167-Chlamydomonas_euryale.AAC.2
MQRRVHDAAARAAEAAAAVRATPSAVLEDSSSNQYAEQQQQHEQHEHHHHQQQQQQHDASICQSSMNGASPRSSSHRRSGVGTSRPITLRSTTSARTAGDGGGRGQGGSGGAISGGTFCMAMSPAARAAAEARVAGADGDRELLSDLVVPPMVGPRGVAQNDTSLLVVRGTAKDFQPPKASACAHA